VWAIALPAAGAEGREDANALPSVRKLNCAEMKYYHLILSGLFACVFYQMQAQRHRLLRDPYVYETAAEMYAVADTLPFDDTAALLVADVSRHLEQGLMPEDDIIWDTLQKLEPYRKSGQVQQAMKTWTEYIWKAEGSGSASATDNSRLISPVSQAYYRGEFDKVIALSRELLSDPELKAREELVHVVRNNLALALMHENRDLCAQMELELLNIETNTRYFPALINLTVVYERLGKRKEAELLANRLTEYMKKQKLEMPLIDFNAAWFPGEKGNYRSVNKALKKINTKLMKEQEVPKYADYRKLLTAKYKSFSILKIGFLEKYYTGSGGWWIIGILIFIVYWVVIAIRGGMALFKYLIEESDLSFFLMSLLILLYFIPVFILAWGIPCSVGGWIGLVVLIVGSYTFLLVQEAKNM
jgi:tetratricopeptide (TPR) repeat protein